MIPKDYYNTLLLFWAHSSSPFSATTTGLSVDEQAAPANITTISTASLLIHG
jgi:hypothetical protein